MKPVKLFPTLYAIEPFINRVHPIIHPDLPAYKAYWEIQEKRCLEGFWALDQNGSKGGWRYMPPTLYFYINYGIIEMQDKKTNSVVMKNPDLRDVEWLFHYGWLTTRGFSGFIDDGKYSCNKLLLKIHAGTELTPKEKESVSFQKEYLLKEDGTYKEYVDAREYLYKTHLNPLGAPLYGNDATNFFVLTSRGSGKSYNTASIINHEFSFFGKKYYDADYLSSPDGCEIAVGAALTSKSSDLLKKFSVMQEHLKVAAGSWGSGDDFVPGYFYLNVSGQLGPNNNKSPYRHEYRYKEGNIWKVGGTNTRLYHVAYGDNSEAAVGSRPTLMAIEEVGLCNSLLDIHQANETCMIRDYKFGSAIYTGTGGNVEKIVESKIVFTDPESYDFLPYPDKWENRIKPIGFFLPAYYTDNSFKDEFGNTRLEEALEEELIQRKKRSSASNSSALDGYMMARPLVPSEMFLSPTANIFPTARLRGREAEIETKNLFETISSIGDLEWRADGKSVTWIEDLTTKRNKRPITVTNLDVYKGHIEGAVVIYEHPSENIPNPTYSRSLYKVTYDPVRDDHGGSSLAAILVFKGVTTGWNSGIQNSIVAEWVGRLDKVRDIHEIALKLAYYYNAQVLFENNIPDFIRYCKDKGHVGRLALSPYEALNKGAFNVRTKYEYGVPMTKALNEYGEQLIRQWLLETWKTLSNGANLVNIDKLYSLRLIRELILYDREHNCDYVSAFKLLMLWLNSESNMVFVESTKVKDPYKDLDNFYKSTVRQHSSVHTKKNPWYASR